MIRVYAIGIISVIILILIITVVMALKKKSGSEGQKEENDAVASETKNMIKAGQKPTLAQSKVEALANTISSSLSSAGYSKSDAFSNVYRAFLNLGNDLDMLNLKKAYGTRAIDNGALNWKTVPNLTLAQSVALLTPNEVNLINVALAKKNITRF